MYLRSAGIPFLLLCAVSAPCQSAAQSPRGAQRSTDANVTRHEDPSELIIVSANLELRLTDFRGRVTGPGAKESTSIEDIPKSSYFVDFVDSDDPAEPDTENDSYPQLEVFNPSEGPYRLDVIGTKPGSFKVTVHMWLRDGSEAPDIELNGITAAGASCTYELLINPNIGIRYARIATFNSTLDDISVGQELGLFSHSNSAESLSATIRSAQAADESRDIVKAKAKLSEFAAILSAQGKEIRAPLREILSNDQSYLDTQLRQNGQTHN
jgi:hypothetical protein